MTNAEAVKYCQQAYRSLKSYHGRTAVETLLGYPDGVSQPIPHEVSDPRTRSSAEIWYKKPDRLRVQGNLSRYVWESEDDPFEMVSDGNTTWSRWSVTEQEWEKEESADLAIGGFHGVSGGACTTIPCLLLGESLAYAHCADSAEAEKVIEADRPAWRVRIISDVGETTYWIDQESGLLLRLHSLTDLVRVNEGITRLHQRMRAEGIAIHADWIETPEIRDAEAPVSMDSTEIFIVIEIDADLPVSMFRRPKGAPE